MFRRIAVAALACSLVSASACVLGAEDGAGSGSRIVFVYSEKKGQADLHTILPNGTGNGRIAAGHYDLPVFSPDRSQIAVVRVDERATAGGRSQRDYQLWVMNADGSNPHVVASEFGFAVRPTWMPDSKRLVYSHENGIHLVASDGMSAKQIGEGLSPHPSPDGDSIVFTRYQEGVSDVWIMQADGSNVRRVANGTNPRWSPQGDRLLFLLRRMVVNSLGHQNSVYDLWVMRADGRGQKRLDEDAGLGVLAIPEWSPSGAWIAYHHDSNVWVVNPEDGNRRQLTRIDRRQSSRGPLETEQTLSICWSPDSTRVAFVHSGLTFGGSVMPSKMSRQIRMVNVDGSELRNVTLFRGASEDPDWR